MKKHLSTIILVLILVAGIGLLTYPSFSNWWNVNHTTRTIANYNAAVEKTDTALIRKLWDEAVAYNNDLYTGHVDPLYDEGGMERYQKTLDASGLGIMGYVEIPSLKLSLPIYHTTEETVLMVGIGHLEWTSLPVGGENTHCVVSGHRGLPSARLFTDIDQLVVGDLFYLDVLDRELAYEVDQILIVLPEEMDAVKIQNGEDLCTLVTCTPYGVNSHRLLVRGHRVDAVNSDKPRVTADAIQIRPVQVAPFVAAPILLVLLILLFTTPSQVDDYDDDNPKGGVFRA